MNQAESYLYHISKSNLVFGVHDCTGHMSIQDSFAWGLKMVYLKSFMVYKKFHQFSQNKDDTAKEKLVKERSHDM